MIQTFFGISDLVAGDLIKELVHLYSIYQSIVSELILGGEPNKDDNLQLAFSPSDYYM